MSLIKQLLPDDPFGAIAWRACIAVLATEKILLGHPLDNEEREALQQLLKDVSELEATRQKIEEETATNFRALEFYWLVDTYCHDRDAGDLDIFEKNLRLVVDGLQNTAIDKSTLKSVQWAAFMLAQKANALRP